MHDYDEEISDMCARIMETGFMQSPEGRIFVPEYNQLISEKANWEQKMNSLRARYVPEFRRYLENKM